MLQLGDLGAGHLPVVLAIAFTVNLSTTYAFAVWYGDVDPVFPYISTSGDRRPESCFFSMLLNFCAVLTMVIIYIRYLLIKELDRGYDQYITWTNISSLVIGLIGGFGMYVVANFQETAVSTVHMVSAFVCFGFGCLYMLMQSFLTVRMYPSYTNRSIGYIRSTIAVTSSLCFMLTILFGFLAASEFHKHFPDLPTPRPWSSKVHQPGYQFHCVSALAEWTLAICNVGFLLSYSRDFEKIQVGFNVQALVSHLDQSPLRSSSYADINNTYLT